MGAPSLPWLDETSSKRADTSMNANSISLGTLGRALLGVGMLLAAPYGFGRDYYDTTWDTLYPRSASDDNARCALCHGSTTSGSNKS